MVTPMDDSLSDSGLVLEMNDISSIITLPQTEYGLSEDLEISDMQQIISSSVSTQRKPVILTTKVFRYRRICDSMLG